MESVDKMVKRELKKKNKSKILLGNSLYHVTPDMEFAKWLAYETEEEKRILKLLPDMMTKEQVNKLMALNERKRYSKIFNKYAYNLEKCSNEEYIIVYNYMKNYSIEELMEERLTSLELSRAKDEIARIYTSKNNRELDKYLESFNTSSDRTAYEKMSIIDAYIFHYLSKAFIESKRNSTDVKVYTLNNLCYKVN